MSDQKHLDSVESIVELKNLEANIVEKFDELKANGEQLQGQVAELGEAKAETLAKHEALEKQYFELYDRVQVVEQKGQHQEANRAESLGEMFAKSDQATAMMEGRFPSARVDYEGEKAGEFKTAIINATGQNQPLVPSDRLGGIATTPNRVLTIRDILPSSSTSSNLVEFTREDAFTNAAAPTVSGSPEAYENVTKPESAITFTLVNVPVVTVAHFIPASKQVLSDSASLSSHINGRLMYGLKLKEEQQLLTGTGANHQLNGLITQATSYVPTSPQLTNEIDIIRHCQKQAFVAEYQPNFLVLNPSDWYDIEIRKVGSSDDRYVVGNPNNMMSHNLWGLNVVVTNSVSAGTFLMGSSAAAEIKDRESASVEMSQHDGNNFTKNMVTILAEERLALLLYRTEAMITGSL